MPHDEQDRRGATENGYNLDTRFKEPRVRVTMFFEPEIIKQMDEVMLKEGHQSNLSRGRTKFFQEMFQFYVEKKGFTFD